MINGDDCRSISVDRSEIDVLLITTEITSFRIRSFVRLDPPKPLPVANAWRVIEFVAGEDNLE